MSEKAENKKLNIISFKRGKQVKKNYNTFKKTIKPNVGPNGSWF